MQFITILVSAIMAFSTVSAVPLAAPALVAVELNEQSVNRTLTARNSGGWATFYNQEGGYGSCGEQHSDNDFIVAVSDKHYGHNSLCGRYMDVFWNGVGTNVRIVDTCVACGPDDVDLSVRAFNHITNNNPGLGKIFGITWNLL